MSYKVNAEFQIDDAADPKQVKDTVDYLINSIYKDSISNLKITTERDDEDTNES